MFLVAEYIVICCFTLLECRDVKNCHLTSPWASMAEMVDSDLISASQNVKNEMADGSLEEIKPVAVVRFLSLIHI